MSINKVFELGRRAVRKELVALRGEKNKDEFWILVTPMKKKEREEKKGGLPCQCRT